MALTLVQSNTATGNGTSKAVALSNVASGNLLTLQAFCYTNVQGYAPDVPTDSQGTWLSASSAVMSASGALAGIFYQAAVAAGTHTVTLTLPAGGSGNIWLTLAEWSGIAASAVFDTGSTPHTTAVMSQSGDTNPTAAVAQANEIVLCCIAIAAGLGSTTLGLSAPAGFTQFSTPINAVSQNDATNIGGQNAYKISTTLSGTQSASWTWNDTNSTAGYQAAIATFKGAAAGGLLNSFRRGAMTGGMLNDLNGGTRG